MIKGKGKVIKVGDFSNSFLEVESKDRHFSSILYIGNRFERVFIQGLLNEIIFINLFIFIVVKVQVGDESREFNFLYIILVLEILNFFIKLLDING
jgi:hypothetical protein